MSQNNCTVSDELRRFSNRIAYEVAEAHKVRIIELVHTKLCRRHEVSEARRDFAARMTAEVVYRDPQAILRKGDVERLRWYKLRNEIPESELSEWSECSTPDIARCLACNHSTIVLALRQRFKPKANGETQPC